MCLAAVIGPDSTLDKDSFNRAWDKNPHGGGLAFIRNNMIWIFKTQDSPDRLYEEFKKAEDACDNGADILVHFRYATHGSKCIENTHPFIIAGNRAAVIHNGVIQIQREGDRTDSEQFARDYIDPFFGNGWITSPAVQKFLEHELKNSKVAILSLDHPTIILNKNLGITRGDSWFSNLSFEEKKYIPHVHKHEYGKKKKKTTWTKKKHKVGEVVFRNEYGMSVYMGEGEVKWYDKDTPQYSLDKCLSCDEKVYVDEWALCYNCRPHPQCECGRKLWEVDLNFGKCWDCRNEINGTTGFPVRPNDQKLLESPEEKKKQEEAKRLLADSGDIKCYICKKVLSEDDLKLCENNSFPLCIECVEDMYLNEGGATVNKNEKISCVDCKQYIYPSEDPALQLTDRCWSCEQVKKATAVL